MPPAPAASQVEQIAWGMQSAFGSSLDRLGPLGIRLGEQLVAVSNGRIILKFFEPGTLIPNQEIHDAVGKGLIESAWTTPGYITGREPSFQVFATTPFGPDPHGLALWLTSPDGISLRDECYRPLGLKSLICGVLGQEGGGWFRNPIQSVADLRGLKMRFFGIGALVMQKLGVSTQLLTAADIYPALQQGVIDAARRAWQQVVAEKSAQDPKFGRAYQALQAFRRRHRI